MWRNTAAMSRPLATSAVNSAKPLRAGLALAAGLACGGFAAAQTEPGATPRATIAFRATPVTVDGTLDEWDQPPTVRLDRADQVWSQRRDPAMRWLGPDDLEAKFWLAYDATRLWIAGRVRDDGLVAGRVGAEWHQGDAIELFFDLGDAAPVDGATEFGPEVLQWFLMPFSPERPWGVMDWRNRPATPSGASLTGVDFVCRHESESVYTFEAVLPFHNFPRIAGRSEIGFSIAVDDHDPGREDRYQYVTWNGEQLVDHREHLGRLAFGGPPPLQGVGAGDESALGWLAGSAPVVLLPALGLVVLSLLLWAWSRLSRRYRGLRPVGPALGVVMFGAGLLLPGWLVTARVDAQRDRLRLAVDTLVAEVPKMEGGLLSGYRGLDRDRTLIGLVDGGTIARERRYRYTMHADVAAEGRSLGARTRAYPGLGFDVRPYAIPLPRGEREVISFRERLRPGRLNLVLARPLVVSGAGWDPISATEPGDDVLQLDVSLHRSGGAPVELAIEVPGPFSPTGDPGLERMELSYRTIRVDAPLDSLGLTCRSDDGVRLVGITWLSAADAEPAIVPLALGSDTLGGVPTDLRGPWPSDAGVELRENGGNATFRLSSSRPDEFQKLWVVFSGTYRAQRVDLAVGSHVAELTISFAEPGVPPKVVPFQHQRSMFFEQDRANRELQADGVVRVAHRWEGDDKESHADFVREIDLPPGVTPVALELRNLGPYAIRFRTAIFGSEVIEAPTSTADSPLVRGDDGESLRPAIVERLRGIDFAIYRNGRLSSATGDVDTAVERVVLPEEFRRTVPDDGVRARVVTAGDRSNAEAFVALPGEAWSGTVLGASVSDPDHGDFARFVHRVGTVMWLASLPILLLLFSELLATLGSLRVRLIAVLSLASVVPLLVLSVVLVRVIENDHEEKRRERMGREIASVEQQVAEQRVQLVSTCDVWLADLAAVVRARGLAERNETNTAFREALQPILQNQVPPDWADSCALEFEFNPSAEREGAVPVSVTAAPESMRSLDTQLRSETGVYLSWSVPMLGVRRALEIPGQGTCALSVARRIDPAFLAGLVRNRATVLCDLRGYPLAASGSDTISADQLAHEAHRPATMAAREALARDGASSARSTLLRHVEGPTPWVGAYGVLLDVQNRPRLLVGVVEEDVPATLPLAVGRVPARTFFASVAGLLALVAVFLSFVVTTRISRPIERIERGAQALRRGDLDVHIESDERGQIGRLTRTFNQMAHDLRGRIDDLHSLNRGIQTLASRLELGDVVAAAVAFCMRHTQADAVHVLLRDRGRERVDLLSSGPPCTVPTNSAVADLLRAEGPCSLLPSALRAVLEGDSQPGSAMAFPLRVAGRTRGLLLLSFVSARAPAVDLELLATIAAQTAAAAENARLYQLAVEDVRTGALRLDYFATRLADEVGSAERDGETVALGGLRIEAPGALTTEARTAALERAVFALRGELGPEALIARSGEVELRVATRGMDDVTLRDGLGRTLARLDADVLADTTVGWRTAVVAFPRDAASAEFLVDALGMAIATDAGAEPRAVRDPGHSLVLSSPAMDGLMRVIERVAPTDIAVLLIGETGTGKEVFADLVHRWSRRADGPLIKVHCAALPESLLASELFGHEKGAFTGAVERKLGRFEQASGGTIFLDEIGEISPDVQVKLLRVLQEHEIDRVGGTQPIRVDVRVVAATNCDLDAMVRNGTFREDLYYRLQGVLLRVPPLRERRAEIPALVEQFRLEAVAAGQTAVEGFAPDGMDELFRAEWRGNVRELRNTVFRALVLATGSRVTRADLLGLDPAVAAVPPARETVAPAEPLVLIPRPGTGASAEAAAPRAGVHGRAAEVLALLDAADAMGSQDCATALGISQRTALRVLTELTERGLAIRIGKRRGARYRGLGNSDNAALRVD